MTGATGRHFMSYRRARIDELRLLVEAHHEHGIPTWLDVNNLDHAPTEDQIRQVLEDETLSSGLLWLTPEVADSDIIRNVEAPSLLKRARAGDGFFLVPIAAGGLDYDDAGATLVPSLDDIRRWNIHKASRDPIQREDAVLIALRVLGQRLRAFHVSAPPEAPLRIKLHTRVPAAAEAQVALALDWSHRFTARETSPEDWATCLLPSLDAVVQAIRVNAPGRVVLADGFASLPACFALGRAFLETAGIQLVWAQRGAEWSLASQPVDSEARERNWSGDPSSRDLAALISVNAPVEHAVAKTVPVKFRAFVETHLLHPSFDVRLTPGQAVDLAHRVARQLRRARATWPEITRIHLFGAMPAGLAVLIGQLLNTLGPIQTYEHLQTDAHGVYRRAALLLDL
jgi:hypothetical protein